MKIIRKLKYPLTIILIITLIIYIYLTKQQLNKNKYNDSLKEELIVEETTENEIDDEMWNIDIKGAIQKPGVYKINCNNTINDIINLSGGLTKEADTSLINLAKKIEDEMVIIIYTKEEVKNSNIVDTVIKVVEKECVCPNIENDGCINDKIENTIENNNLININTATLEILMTIPGIGESKAKTIIEYRNENGNFNSIEDLLNVNGIGEKLYEQIKIHIKT